VTRKHRLLIFSVLVNNYSGSGVAVRRKVERLLHTIREKY
jgi:D-alanyl-D-alanine carboxypeptidase